MSKNKYNEALFIIIKNAIDKWNPYGLILPNTPSDEFDSESKAVATKIDLESTADDIARVISKVFSSSFEQQYFQKSNCIAVAEEIKQNISDILKK